VATPNLPSRSINSNCADSISLEVGAANDLSASRHLLTDELLDPRVRKILLLIESGKTFSIRNLAIECNLSPSYLQRLFKHQTGIAIGKWLSEGRLRRAAQLLANGYMSVKEIAHSVGYEHTSSFIRAFERRFTWAPACYRRQVDRTKY
jgi:AraC-like DNA-binding protein